MIPHRVIGSPISRRWTRDTIRQFDPKTSYGDAVGSTNLSTPGVLNTKGTWTAFVASASRPYNAIILVSNDNMPQAGIDNSMIMDIGFGAALSEVVVVPDISIGWHVGLNLIVPIQVPLATRISMRKARSSTLSGTSTFAMCLANIPWLDSGKLIETLGTVAASSKGTTLGVPGAINTEGAWTAIGTSAAAWSCFFVSTGGGADTTMLSVNTPVLVDIGVGTAAGEIEIISNLAYNYNTSEQIRSIGADLPILYPTAAGTKFYARYQSQSTGDSIDVSIHGVPVA